MTVVEAAGLLVLCAALSFVPGYGLLAPFARLRPAERLACSGLVSAAVCGLAALAAFLPAQGHLVVSPWAPVVLPLGAGVAGLAVARGRGVSLGLDAAARQVGWFWLLLLAELTAIELVLPSFGGAGWFADWWVHFHRALVYGNLVPVTDAARTCVDPRLHCMARVYDNGVLTARTPLYNLLGGIAVGIDGGRLGAFQIAAAAWGAVLAGPVVLLAQRRGPRVGALAGTLLLLNPFLIHLAVYPWPKVLTAAFEVAAVYWICRLRDGEAWAGFGVGASLVLAMYTHQAASVYALAAGLYLWRWAPRVRGWRRALGAGACAAGALTLPWVLWGMRIYGWRGVFLSSPTTRSGQPGGMVFVGNKVAELFYSFVPVPFVRAVEAGMLSGTGHRWLAANLYLEFPFDTYTGALGCVACLLLVAWRRSARMGGDLLALGALTAVCAALGSVLLDSAYLTSGAAVNAMAGAVALGLVFLATLEPAQRHRRWVLALVGAEAVVDAAVYFGYLSVGTWRADPDTVVLGGMGQAMLSTELGRGGVLALIAVLALTVLGVAWIGMAFGTRPRRTGEVPAGVRPLAASDAWAR